MLLQQYVIEVHSTTLHTNENAEDEENFGILRVVYCSETALLIKELKGWRDNCLLAAEDCLRVEAKKFQLSTSCPPRLEC